MNGSSVGARSSVESPDGILSHLYTLPDQPLVPNNPFPLHEIPHLDPPHDETLGNIPISRQPDETTLNSQSTTREDQAIVSVPDFALDPDTLGPFLQRIRSLESPSGFTAQLSGSSGESDPWLLRHCRYDEYGMCNFPRASFRTVGGVPYEHLVPVHFIVAENSLYDAGKEEFFVEGNLGEAELLYQLNSLVPPSDGRRLICL